MSEIIFFDLETTGVNQDKDSIIQIAAIKINTETDDIVDKINEYIKPEINYSISIGAYLKHGITPEFLDDKQTLRDLAPRIIEFFGNNIPVCTYNGNRFDIPFLQKELMRIGYSINFMDRDCYDVFCEETRRHGNNLESTYKRYYGRTMEEDNLSAHNALSDVEATYKIFKKQQEDQQYGPEKRYCDDGIIGEKEINGNSYLCFLVGKYKDTPVSYVAKYDKQYLKWIVSDKCSFMPSTKRFIKKFIVD